MTKTPKEHADNIRRLGEELNIAMEQAFNAGVRFTVVVSNGTTAGLQVDAPKVDFNNVHQKL